MQGTTQAMHQLMHGDPTQARQAHRMNDWPSASSLTWREREVKGMAIKSGGIQPADLNALAIVDSMIDVGTCEQWKRLHSSSSRKSCHAVNSQPTVGFSAVT